MKWKYSSFLTNDDNKGCNGIYSNLPWIRNMMVQNRVMMQRCIWYSNIITTDKVYNIEMGVDGDSSNEAMIDIFCWKLNSVNWILRL